MSAVYVDGVPVDYSGLPASFWFSLGAACLCYVGSQICAVLEER